MRVIRDGAATLLTQKKSLAGGARLGRSYMAPLAVLSMSFASGILEKFKELGEYELSPAALVLLERLTSAELPEKSRDATIYALNLLITWHASFSGQHVFLRQNQLVLQTLTANVEQAIRHAERLHGANGVMLRELYHLTSHAEAEERCQHYLQTWQRETRVFPQKSILLSEIVEKSAAMEWKSTASTQDMSSGAASMILAKTESAAPMPAEAERAAIVHTAMEHAQVNVQSSEPKHTATAPKAAEPKASDASILNIPAAQMPAVHELDSITLQHREPSKSEAASVENGTVPTHASEKTMETEIHSSVIHLIQNEEKTEALPQKAGSAERYIRITKERTETRQRLFCLALVSSARTLPRLPQTIPTAKMRFYKQSAKAVLADFLEGKYEREAVSLLYREAVKPEGVSLAETRPAFAEKKTKFTFEQETMRRFFTEKTALLLLKNRYEAFFSAENYDIIPAYPAKNAPKPKKNSPSAVPIFSPTGAERSIIHALSFLEQRETEEVIREKLPLLFEKSSATTVREKEKETVILRFARELAQTLAMTYQVVGDLRQDLPRAALQAEAQLLVYTEVKDAVTALEKRPFSAETMEAERVILTTLAADAIGKVSDTYKAKHVILKKKDVRLLSEQIAVRALSALSETAQETLLQTASESHVLPVFLKAKDAWQTPEDRFFSPERIGESTAELLRPMTKRRLTEQENRQRTGLIREKDISNRERHIFTDTVSITTEQAVLRLQHAAERALAPISVARLPMVSAKEERPFVSHLDSLLYRFSVSQKAENIERVSGNRVARVSANADREISPLSARRMRQEDSSGLMFDETAVSFGEPMARQAKQLLMPLRDERHNTETAILPAFSMRLYRRMEKGDSTAFAFDASEAKPLAVGDMPIYASPTPKEMREPPRAVAEPDAPALRMPTVAELTQKFGNLIDYAADFPQLVTEAPNRAGRREEPGQEDALVTEAITRLRKTVEKSEKTVSELTRLYTELSRVNEEQMKTLVGMTEKQTALEKELETAMGAEQIGNKILRRIKEELRMESMRKNIR